MQHVLVPFKFQSVPCIRSALETRNEVVLPGQHIDDLSLSLISPLESEENIHIVHCLSSLDVPVGSFSA